MEGTSLGTRTSPQTAEGFARPPEGPMCLQVPRRADELPPTLERTLMAAPDEEPEPLAAWAIFTRREDAAAAYGAGIIDSIERVDSAAAVAALCGWGVEGTTDDDVRLNMLHTMARWTGSGDHQLFRTPDGLVSTPLTPEDDWEQVDGALDANSCWSVLGAGLADSETGARTLAVKAWVYELDVGLLDSLPAVFVDLNDHTESIRAAAFARQRGVPSAEFARAYGLVRAAGLPVNWETLAAAAIGLATPSLAVGDTPTDA